MEMCLLLLYFYKTCCFVIEDHNLTSEYIFSDDRSYDFLLRIRILLYLDEIFFFHYYYYSNKIKFRNTINYKN